MLFRDTSDNSEKIKNIS